MARRIPAAPKAGEHPLMSNRSLRSMYVGLASAHDLLTGSKARAALNDSACFIAPFEGLVSMDVVFGCRSDGLLEQLRPKQAGQSPITQPLLRLYAAIGAAMTAHGQPPLPVVVVYFEHHEINPASWLKALQRLATLPLLIVVLPRRKGREDVDLPALARSSGVPVIPVDAQDPVALFRVAQEALGRARVGGGAAILQAFHLDGPSAMDKLARYLTANEIASASWLARNGSNSGNAPLKRK